MIHVAATGAQAALPFDMLDANGEPVLGYTFNVVSAGITDDFLVRLPAATVYANTETNRIFEHGDGGAHYELDAADSETFTAGKVYYRWLPSEALVIADQVVTFDTTDNEVDWTAHGRKTGDGPVQFTTTGALPTGLAVATDYWIIKRTANAFSLATSKAGAISNVEIDMTTVGSGTQTLVDTASTRAVLWDYETRARWEDIVSTGVMNAGIAQAGAALTITLVSTASATNDLYIDGVIEIVGGTGAGQTNTITDYVGASKIATVARTWATNPDNTSRYVIRQGAAALASAQSVWDGLDIEGAHKASDILRGIASGVFAKMIKGVGTASFRDLADTKDRYTITYDATGRPTSVVLDLT